MSFLKILLLFIFLFSLSGCGKKNSPRRTIITYEESEEKVSRVRERKSVHSAKRMTVLPHENKTAEKTQKDVEKQKKAPVSIEKQKETLPAQQPPGSNSDKSSGNWCSEEILTPPAATDKEIWNNIMQALKKRIYAREVIFSVLGTKSALLTRLSAERFKASGRCLIIDETGKEFPYLFECTANASRYKAVILTSKFSVPNMKRK